MNSELAEKGYVVLRNFFSKEICDFSRVYFRIRQETLEYDIDRQCPLSKSFYGDPFAESLMLSSAKKLSEITDLMLIPTYSYTRIYSKHEELVLHRDRPECQYSVTCCLGRPMSEPVSAIYFSKFEDGSNATEVFLEPGDVCIYRGMDIYHWRKPFEQSWYLQTFLHYVDGNDKYADRLYDGRRSLGIKKGQSWQFTS